MLLGMVDFLRVAARACPPRSCGSLLLQQFHFHVRRVDEFTELIFSCWELISAAFDKFARAKKIGESLNQSGRVVICACAN
jgi:DNA-directed RNA polymerase subunit N (RpoN/RPB10)